mmetsp:Transcript_13188/g.11271  ORF Transcript_13188/g.11271 Transcript_13188/m.11271 type:complete len:104 (-) Transcript_13188:882-1193(-)|eukprot:CAMPEP_0114582190 /NCGR_PEP_ID=MMETSP0125-20121206/6212_1 /TAXON_ID=485358 ORGANISM="Aristerostoma sp., Strain ATCC 50986" /NCGR_SAMPLE_ID=MMETSP0125 /ASSEMBLY_ACC=CAM_ASM_000245 /LENGTH=103 /DNA_ID=CAMNT_0001774977 /DNA_START=981 /DNA_END=1292 /DNA_ORIENTATION=+
MIGSGYYQDENSKDQNNLPKKRLSKVGQLGFNDLDKADEVAMKTSGRGGAVDRSGRLDQNVRRSSRGGYSQDHANNSTMSGKTHGKQLDPINFSPIRNNKLGF